MCFWLSGLKWRSVSQFLHMSVKTNKQSGGDGCGGSATCSNLAWPVWCERVEVHLRKESVEKAAPSPLRPAQPFSLPSPLPAQPVCSEKVEVKVTLAG